MSPSQNGWQDQDPEEREALDVFFEDDEERWRGNVHGEDWPEILAGPEYWFYKGLYRDGEAGE